MLELEKTYLAKNLPQNLKDYTFKEIIDIYIPKNADHPVLRLRKNGDAYEMTKKQPIVDSDASRQIEQTIILSKEEFGALEKIEGKKTHKFRYYYDYKGNIAEIDIFMDDLAGLAIIDFEFKTDQEKDFFLMPDFCLADVTQEKFLAGGMLCGKKYEDIKKDLDRFNYQKLFLK